MMSNEAMKDRASSEESKFLPVLKVPKIETEEELFKWVDQIAAIMHKSKLMGCYELGACLNSYLDIEYGARTIALVSDRIAISRHTLYKARQFSRDFLFEEAKELLSGKFPISWNVIQANLTVSPIDLIRVYKSSNSLKEFTQKIKEFKKQDGPSKSESDNQFCSNPTNSDDVTEENNPICEDEITSVSAEDKTVPTNDSEDKTAMGESPENGENPIGKNNTDPVDLPSPETEITKPSNGDQRADNQLKGDDNGDKPTSKSPEESKADYMSSLKPKEKADPSETTDVQADQDSETNGRENQGKTKDGETYENQDTANQGSDEDSYALAKKVKEYEAQIKSLQDEIKTLKKEKADLEQKVIQLELENDMLRGQLDDLETDSDEEECDALTELDF